LVDQRAIIRAYGRDAGLTAVGVDAEVALAEEDELVAGNVVFGDGFADDFF